MKQKQRNTDLDFIRAVLIMLMILIHIVSFGNAYPHLKAGILSFMMPTFLIITGYLVNIEKSWKQMGKYLLCLALPYVIMVTGFSVLSYFMPVRDGITELSFSQICEKIFVTSIGPYWFIQTMIICGALYYLSFKCIRWDGMRMGGQEHCKHNSLVAFSLMLVLVSLTPALSTTAAAYYFIGVVIRQSKAEFSKIFRPSYLAIWLWAVILLKEDRYNWAYIAVIFSCWCCISTLMWVRGTLSVFKLGKIDSTILYIGRNTLPIYLFHPIFTMAAKFYHPLFGWDSSEIAFALFTVVLAIVGSIGIAKLMEMTHTALIFGKEKILR